MILGLVPARGGSKSIPNKNLRLLGGKPLVVWSIEAAKASGALDRIVLSTDSEAIAELGPKNGAEVLMRPPELASDTAPMIDVLKHAIGKFKATVIVLLQPTQPFRAPGRINEGLELLADNVTSVVSVVEVPSHHSPDVVMRFARGLLVPFDTEKHVTRRQDARRAYARDGTAYIIRRQTIEGGSQYGPRCVPFVIPAGESVTLDEESDWQEAERRLGA